MKSNTFLRGLTILALTLLPMHDSFAEENLPYSEELQMIVGTYTGTGSKGIYSMKFNQETGDWRPLNDIFIVNPSYLTLSPDGDRIYAVSETSDSTASVYSLSLDRESGAMAILDSRPTVGTDPCYVSTNGKVVVTANYGGTLNVFPITSDGSVGDIRMVVEGHTGGPDTIRQIKPHIHCAEFSPDGKILAVSDFSADRLLVFEVTDNGNDVAPVITDKDEDFGIEVSPDSGPRHVVFSSDGRFVYLLGELSGDITVFKVDGHDLSPIQTIVADPLKGRASGDIHISPDGKFLYASVRRANDGIAIYKIDGLTGQLTYIGYERTGVHPRNFAITPNGRFLLCACRDSDRIDIFRIDLPTGLLIKTGKAIDLPKPVCVKFH